jgi:hypothetical protein
MTFAPDSLCTDQASEDGDGRHCPSPSIPPLGLGAISCFIRDTLAPRTLQRVISTLRVIHAKRNPVVVPEIELAQIPLQMNFGDVLVNAVDASLEDAEIALNGVGMDIATNVFAVGVVDGAMRSEVVADIGVNLGLVGHQDAIERNVARHGAAQGVGANSREVERPYSAVTLDEGNNRLLFGNRQESLGASLAAHISFVDFDGLARAAHRRGEKATLIFHGLPNAMGEEPSGFHAAFEHALNLPGADSLLAGAHEMDDLQPKMQRQMAVLKDGPHPDGEGLLAGVAFPKAKAGGLALKAADLLSIRVAAMRADRTIGPKHRLDMIESGGFIFEMRGVQNGLGHDQNFQG